jgi:hypothetical protein
VNGLEQGIATLVIVGRDSMTEIVFLKDKEWGVIDGELCRVKVFTPLSARVESGRVIALDRTTPYASIVIECTKLPQDATGYITNRLDFLHLWSAFIERGVGEDEEVIVFWTRKNYKTYARLLPSVGMPKLWVNIYRAGAYEMWTDPQVETTSEGLQTLAQWKPDVMV